MKSWTILEILNWTKDHFQEKQIENPRLNAEMIITHVLRLKRLELYMQFDRIVNPQEREKIKQMILRRSKHEPLQYILGETDFYGLRIKLNTSVLIPRPETELLVGRIIKEATNLSSILEIGTGSGCIAIALKKNLPNCLITASDVSEKAIETARNNANLNDVKIDFINSDLFENISGCFDLIVSNPPYISFSEYKKLPEEIREFEPRSALQADENGLYFYRKILENGNKYLKENGKIYFEIGDSQKQRIKLIAEKNGFSNIESVQDLNGLDRIMIIGR